MSQVKESFQGLSLKTPQQNILVSGQAREILRPAEAIEHQLQVPTKVEVTN